VRKSRRPLLLPALLWLVAALPIPAAFAAQDAGAKIPREEGLHLRMAGGETVRLPRFAGKPCGAVTAGLPAERSKEGKEKFVYIPASALAQIPVVSSKGIQEAYLVTRDEKLGDIRNLVFLEPYLDRLKLVTGAYEGGCAEGELDQRKDFLAFSAWGWSFDRVVRATFVDEATTRLQFESRLPFEAGTTRPIAGPKEERIGTFGIYISTDKAYYPFLPDARLAGFLSEAVKRPHPAGLPPHVVELAAKLEKHLEASGESDPAARKVIAAVKRAAKGLR
jgi:hypothetical protein